MNHPVNLVVNGASVMLQATTLAEALALWMEEDARIEAIGERAVATALNGKFVPAAKRAATQLNAGDRVEILAPMQGG
jgi:sulfur carrier protein